MKKSILIIALITIFFSCKKKDTTEPDNSINNTTGGNNTSGTYASFVSRKQAVITNTNVSSLGNFTSAFVSSAPLTNHSPSVGTLLDMGQVFLNSIIFQKNAWSVANMYKDSTETVHNTPHNWIVSGSLSVPSFSFSNTNAYPIYTGQAAIADSFVVSGNVSIPLTNYSGSDEVETYFVTSTNPVTNTSIQYITGSPTTLNFTSTDLSVIGPNSNVSLVINFYKNNYQTINGKTYNFRTSYGIIKSNIKFK